MRHHSHATASNLLRALTCIAVLAGMSAAFCLSAVGDELAANQEDSNTETPWRYVEPDPDEFSLRPIPRMLRLSESLPPDATTEATFRGKRQLFCQVRYGSESSTRVLVVVDELGKDACDLYVDSDRDRVIRDDELVPVSDGGNPRERSVALEAEVIPGLLPEHLPRSVIIRRSIAGDAISIATAGIMQGAIKIGETEVACLRVDGDANGLFANTADRVWIDVNQDGTWDPISERFSVRPLIHVNGMRYALRADEPGMRITTEEIVGQGTIKLTVPGLADGSSVQRLEVMLRGDDGSAYSVSGLDAEISLPVGRYALTTVAALISDGKSREPWKFVFSHVSGYGQEVWHELADGDQLSIDAIGELRFEVNANNAARGAKPGDAVTLQPRLFTGDGLLINSCVLGDNDANWIDAHNEARLKLQDPGNERILDSSTSGFS